jgi:hypothetical protein
MKRTILKTTACALVASVMFAAPLLSRAQDSNSPAMSDQTTNAPVKKSKKHDHLVFTGNLTAVDTNAMTFTIKERTFEVTSDTKIFKDGNPATLEDGVVGDKAGGTYKKSDDGKLTALTVRFGEKKKKETSDSSK